MTITADTTELFRRTTRLVTQLRTAAQHLDAAEAEALQGGKSSQDAPRVVTMPTDDAEAPTGHTDPTGDLAVSGRVEAIRIKRKRLADALDSVGRSLGHLELVATAVTASDAPAIRLDTSELCAGPNCNRLKEPGSEHCAEDRAALANLERLEAAPVCGICNATAVETYQTAAGTAYRGMIYDGSDWQPASELVPMCGRCRKAGERAA